jgi:hypothetical protein
MQIVAWLSDHPLAVWFIASAVANILVDVVGASDTTLGRVAKAVGLDLRRVMRAKGPKS